MKGKSPCNANTWNEVWELFSGLSSNEPVTREISEMDRLHAELMRVLGAGVTPDEIIAMLAKHFP